MTASIRLAQAQSGEKSMEWRGRKEVLPLAEGLAIGNLQILGLED